MRMMARKKREIRREQVTAMRAQFVASGTDRKHVPFGRDLNVPDYDTPEYETLNEWISRKWLAPQQWKGRSK